jgi:hypothetical protein
MSYETKYLKYKEKYLNLKNLYKVGGNGDICEFNKDLDVTIYHFTTENLTNTNNIVNLTTGKSIEYIKNSNLDEQKFNTLLDGIIKTCSNKNILIIINSILLPSIVDLFNKYCSTDAFSENLLKNITLINLTDNNKSVLYLYKNKRNIEIFRKNINVFGFKTNIRLNNNTFFNGVNPNQNFTKEVDDKKELSFVLNFSQNGGELRDVNIRLMKTDNNSTKLEDQWWFKWYFSIPPCLSSRLTQSTGTCWMNSIVNSLFFVPEIINLLTLKYKSIPNKDLDTITFNKFNFTHSLNTLLFSLINNLLIKKSKAATNDGNFVGIIASKVKCLYTNTKTGCDNIEFGDGGDPFQGIRIVLREIFNDDYVSYCLSLIDETNKIVQEVNSKIPEYNKNPNDKLKTEIQSLKEILEKNQKFISEMRTGTPTITQDLKNFFINIIKVKLYPKILIFSENIFKNNTINIDGYTYKLCSSSILLNGYDHAIAGIICNNKSYIYDSNNIIVESNWPEEDISAYINNERTKELYTDKKEISFKKISYLIYIRQ